MALSIPRPGAGEHAPYAITYVNATAAALAARGTDDVVALLAAQPAEWRALLGAADPSLGTYRYAPGKWTLAESLVHVADTERVFAYRLLRIARGDRTPLPGFEQDDWVPESRAERRSLADVLNEIEAVRAATLALVRSLDDTAVAQSGISSNHPVTARALIWMLAGHMAHHLTLTREKYLAGA
ncbi:MAG: DinB family protein [Gemmatimonadaceae bacterium]|nr:DinB family protein [Gemmatimonadaceae bacterium]